MSSVASRTAPARPGRVLLPFRHVDWRSRVVGLALAIVPPFAVTLWLAVDGGDLQPICIMLASTVVCLAVIAYQLATTRIELLPDGLRRRSLGDSDRHLSRSDVTRIVLVSVFVRDSLKTTRRLFLVGEDGSTLVHMSTRWWPDTAVSAVARHFDVLPETINEPMTTAELRRMHLVRLFWHEQHPALAALISGAAVVGMSLLVVAVTSTSV